MVRFDVLYGENGLRIENNDVVYAESDKQHVEDTINAAPGWWKESFSDGVDIRKYLNSDGKEQQLSRSIRIQLQSDLYNNCNPVVRFEANGKLSINPNVVI